MFDCYQDQSCTCSMSMNRTSVSSGLQRLWCSQTFTLLFWLHSFWDYPRSLLHNELDRSAHELNVLVFFFIPLNSCPFVLKVSLFWQTLLWPLFSNRLKPHSFTQHYIPWVTEAFIFAFDVSLTLYFLCLIQIESGYCAYTHSYKICIFFGKVFYMVRKSSLIL